MVYAICLQVGLAYILDQCLAKLKGAQEAFPFLKPVDRKKVKDYYDLIKTPMDLSHMEDKNKGMNGVLSLL